MIKKPEMKRTSFRSTSRDLTDEIKRKARELYIKSGSRPGRDLDNWLEAERIVKKRDMRSDLG